MGMVTTQPHPQKILLILQIMGASSGGQPSPSHLLAPAPGSCSTGNCGSRDAEAPPTDYIYALGKVE
jgi:hypothetical protein